MNWLIRNPFAAAPTTAPAATTNIPTDQPPPDAGDPIKVNVDDPTKGDPNKKPEGDGSLGDFGKLWDTDPVDPNKPPQDKVTGFTPQFDQAKLAEQISKIDFTKSVTPEQKAAIIAGGEGATQALMDVLNTTNRQTFASMFAASQRMVESALEKAQKQFLDAVPGHVKDMMVSNALTSSNPIVKNPAYAPMVETVRRKMQEKYPKASATEIETGVNSYFDQMVADMTKKGQDPNAPDNKSQIKSGDPKADWESWFDTN